MNRFTYQSLFCISLTLSSNLASAEIYQWVDQSGNASFSDKKPPAIADATLKKTVKKKRERSRVEIQQVFDKHKGQLYRLYLSARKQDPDLEGGAEFIIDIEPSGEVANIALASSSLDSKPFTDQLMAKIQEFNFGASDTRRTTIHYPIHFFTHPITAN
ncbi:AgmX/PglI C-terminal domain-containing protein [Microbulbifer variabilis]|uniref:AgmX/PglI C-terminal domain-containing protein n=1 Tax=Microbulbifer variabilis TaxID=266805 RepID=A0ABY4VGN3_9GAMM|nr:AgmX/PglI C-terminal domain-containing protein [Microbulbifer variabilis]USD23443.1 AgmX/PglI C-terminal domain-containing protein [Microbulbifer variabilis]